MDYDRLVSTTADVGVLLIKNGAEISRAEESMRRIFLAYGVEQGEVFAIPTFISISCSAPSGRPVTAIRRIPSRRVDMTRVDLANSLCRRVCRQKPDFSTVNRELRKISARRPFPFPAQIAGFAVVAFAFTLFYGGSFADALVAMVCGAVTKPVLRLLEKLRSNLFFLNVAASFVTAAVALTFAHFFVYLSYDKIIIGALMNLVPGIAITDFMRDVIAGDLISSVLRFAESMMIAAAIAIGAGIALTATRMLWGV